MVEGQRIVELKVIVRRAMLFMLVLAASVSLSAEIWRFMPCFRNDVRGIEAHNVADGHFYDAVPEAVRRLLEGGALTEDERREFHWHTVEFPHRDFYGIHPQASKE